MKVIKPATGSRTRKYLCTNVIVGVLSLCCFQIVQGQSRRVLISPQPTPSPTLDDTQIGTRSQCQSEASPNEFKLIVAVGVANFVGQLNESGKCGYRLFSITKLPLHVAEKFDQMTLSGIVKLDTRTNYEYDWFEAFTDAEAQTKINFRAKSGFYFRETLPIAQGLCETDPDTSSEKTDGERISDRLKGFLNFSFGEAYFLERRVDVKERREYRVLTGTAGWGKRPTDELQSKLNDSVRLGFRPVAMGTNKSQNRYAISLLVERSEEFQENSFPPRYVIVRSEFGFEKKVNNLARDGFSLIFEGESTAFRHALMLKDASTSSRTYTWIDSTRKSFPVKLSNLSKQAVNYRGVSSQAYRCDFVERNLVFERIRGKDGSTSEFKILKLNDETSVTEPSSERSSGASNSSDHAMREFSILLGRGYVFRDLFFSNGIQAIFERVRP